MSKRIVFLYCTQKNKERLLLCEKVIRALLRKFRKSALFSYVQIDPSASCREKMRDILTEETARADAVILEAEPKDSFSCNDFINDIFSVFAVGHYASGKAVFYPENVVSVANGESSFTTTTVYEKENIRRVSLLSVSVAKERKHSLSLCLQSSNDSQSHLSREAEYAIAKAKHIDIENVFLDEMISRCVKTIPDFDVILTSKEYAPLITMHLNSVPKAPFGFITSYGEKTKIYKRQILSGDEVSNTPLFSCLIAVAEIFRSEFDMKSASDWLKRAVTLSFESDEFGSAEKFADRVIEKIKLPMRERRTH